MRCGGASRPNDLRHAFQQLRCVALSASRRAQRLARIDQRMVDQLALVAALRRRQLDLAAGPARQRLGEQRRARPAHG